MLAKWQTDFLDATTLQAVLGGHIYPEYAACEAALESGYGRSALAHDDNNLFGMKQHKHPIYGTHVLPTKEFVDQDGDGKKEWVVVNAEWIKYPAPAACFMDRMKTLLRLSNVYPHYAAAINATTGEQFVTEVSKTWSTDPRRAEKVLDIHAMWKGLAFAPIA